MNEDINLVETLKDCPKGCKSFQPFEKVIVAEFADYHYMWTVAFYSHWNERLGLHVTAGGYHYNDEDILPYKSNEDLVGKKTGLEQ